MAPPTRFVGKIVIIVGVDILAVISLATLQYQYGEPLKNNESTDHYKIPSTWV